MHVSKYIATTLVAAGITVSSAPVMAQGVSDAQQNYQKQQVASQQAQFSRSQIQKFARVQQKIRSISSKWRKKIRSENDQQKIQQYRQQANKQMIAAVKKSGLSVKQYNKIANAAQSNPQLAKRIQQAQ